MIKQTSTANTPIAQKDELWILIATILASSMAFIAGNALNVALPAIQRDLKVSGSELLWIVNGYALLLSALILVGGSLGDHYGRKKVFIWGMGIFLVASIFCGLAVNTLMLIIMRIIQGLGAALMVPGSLALITALFAENRRGKAIGTWVTFSTITSVIGPVLGGWLVQIGLWRGIFFINLPLGFIALFILITKVPESRVENIPPELDYLGAFLATFGLAGITYGFIQIADYTLFDWRILLTLGGGSLALIAFIWVEVRSPHPMIDLRLFRSRVFSGTNAMTFFLYGALAVVPLFVTLNLIQIQNYDETQAGLALLPFGILLALLGRWGGSLVDYVGARLPLVVGPFIAGVGFIAFGLPEITDGPQDYWTTFFPAACLLGFGLAITVAPLTTTVMNAAPKEQSGTASGINNAVSRSAGVLAIAILGAIALTFFQAQLISHTKDLALSTETRAHLDSEAAKLAEAQPPSDVPLETQAQINKAIDLAFIDTYRLVCFIGAGLSWLSSLLSFLIIREPKPVVSTVESSA